MEPGDKVYLGDSVYLEFDGYAYLMTTENGMRGDPSNLIYLEPQVLDALWQAVGKREEG